jgi:enterochelin esterase-like enzyme
MPAKAGLLVRRVRASRATALSALVVLWVAVGLLGAWRYVDGYATYRGFAPAKDAPGVAAGTVRKVSFWSPALHEHRHFLVYLPPGYAREAAAGRRFPLLVLLHGHPGGPADFLRAGALNVAMDGLLARHRISPMLVVLPDGRNGLLGPATQWANTKAGRYEGFVLDVVRAADRRFAVLPGRNHRGIGGLSEGAYGALDIALRHPRAFGVVQSWSGYYVQQPTGAFKGASPAVLAAHSPAVLARRDARAIRRVGLRAFIYDGRADRGGAARMRSLAAALRRDGAEVIWRAYRGGHDWALWRRHMPRMLEIAGRWLAAGAAARPAERARAGRRPAMGPLPRSIRRAHARRAR